MEKGFFEVGRDLREQTAHGTFNFPVGLYLQSYEENGRVSKHWHEELQFVFAVNGDTLYNVNGREVLLRNEDILFINSACLHSAVPEGGGGSSYICIDLHPGFLYGYSNEMFMKSFIRPLVSSRLSFIHINYTEAWHRKLRDSLEEFVSVFERKEYGYELEIHSLSLALWLLLLRNNPLAETSPVPDVQEKRRLESMTGFVEEYYTEDLSLTDIAKAGNLSGSECCRFFSRFLGVSPMRYLNNYRINKSAELLLSSEKDITDIAFSSGFSSAAYYTKKFKEQMSLTPREYRKYARKG